ncbi:hypothetical protein ASD78_12190 [Lysobacter sp. Root667]|uniref:DNA-methyltransferase n=1 Tax=Lysobacter sp. Root667 TaxID=1736581 RepID=UPI0007021235|nr:site-specific DNA-methyltransferase [Lysobacter sp. Root667]KRA74247.1 hypothetical protein ASD78_12190 [Lysobacter sp. Root667]
MIHIGDCLEVMRTLAADSVDAIVTDPPYGIGFMGKAWDGRAIVERFEQRDSTHEGRRRNGLASAAGTYDLSPAGMKAFQEFSAAWAREAIRVMKPGAHAVAFASPRTFHRLVCGLEEAGFEIRDTLMWVFGSGFPKSKNLDGDHEGWGTALKPAWEPIILARKPLRGTVAANVAAFGTGALNIDGCRIPTNGEVVFQGSGGIPCRHDERVPRSRAGEASANRRYADRGGTDFAVAPGPRGGDPGGRWPANVLHDGSDEVVAGFPITSSGQPSGLKAGGQGNAFGLFAGGIPVTGFGDAGSAARFFYCAKADRADRNDGCDGLPLRPSDMVSNTSGQHLTRRDGGAPAPAANHHPTVKPTALMRWLCRLVTPPGGLILDPFTGSGSTGRGAIAEGFQFVGIELDPEYVAISEARIRAVQPGLSLGSVA